MNAELRNELLTRGYKLKEVREDFEMERITYLQFLKQTGEILDQMIEILEKDEAVSKAHS